MNRKIRTWVEISLNDLEHNYREISSRLPDGCQMLGVCKANAYGHGAVRVAQRLQRAGCQWVAVNCYDEAEELRAAGVTMNILLLGPQSANIAVDLATLGVTQAVGSIEYARELNRFLAGTGLRLDAHMKLETGMGRTGRLFAMQKYGVTPDIVCLAKAFGGGMPLGAFVARHEVMDTLQENPALGHITTFGGHPVCCAAGLAALNYLVDNKVVERVETKGALYEMLLKDHPAVREIRRSGLLLAVELGESAKLYRIMELFREAGILSDWFLFCDTAFRISPPLTISEDEVRESAALIRSCLDRL